MITLFLFLIAVGCLHVLVKCKYSYWRKKGVKGPAPYPFVGNFGQMMLQKQTLTQLGETAYKQFPDEKVVGLYCGFTPVLLLRDTALINQVMVTDFNNFVNRGVRTTETGFCNNLLIADDDLWRAMRHKMTSTLTSSKQKHMMPLLQKCVSELIQQVEMAADEDEYCDIKEFAAKFTMDVICSCAFGLKLNFYSKEIEQFWDIGKKTIKLSPSFRLWYAAEMLIPGIQKMFPSIDTNAHMRAFFIKLVSTIISERKKTNEKRNDFMDVMINLLDQKSIKISGANGMTELKIDINFIASQAFVFYVTSFETTSSTLSYLLYELASHEHYQDIVYKEICSVLSTYDGELTYDSLNKMSFLEKVYRETLRKHCFLGWLIRKASKDYILSGTNINVEAGTLVLVSISGIHRDAKYFDEPNKFNPENCSLERLNQIPQCAYLPFGIGPRNCIGQTFAKNEVMVAAAAFLKKFKVTAVTENEKNMKFDTTSIVILSPVDGVWIKVSKRK